MFTVKKIRSPGALLELASYVVLLVLIVLLPLAAFTGTDIAPMVTKVCVGGVLILLAFVLYAASRIYEQEVAVPRTLLIASAWLLPGAYFFSTLFASDGNLAFFGKRLSMDSFAFVALGALVLTMTGMILNNQKRAFGVYLAMLGSAILLSIVEFILFFARESVASLGVVLPSLSLLGSLNDLGVFFGLITLFILLSLVLLPLTSVVRGVLSGALALSGLFLAIVNSGVVWWIVGIFALGCFVYSVSAPYLQPSSRQGGVSFASLAVLILCGVFLFSGENISGAPAKWAGVGEFDVRPSWQTTTSLGGKALAGHMLLGSGPGSFERVWSRNMPPEISATAFWQWNFAFGIGFFPTVAITTGVLGILALFSFLALFLWTGAKDLVALRHGDRAELVNYLRVTSFFGALFLWIIAFIQVPSPVLVLYAYLLTGVFVASFTFGGETVSVWKVQFRENPRIGFLVTLALTFSILVSVGGVYGFSTRFLAEIAFQRSLALANTANDLEQIKSLVNRAISLNEVDAYYVFLSNVEMVGAQKLIAENRKPEELHDPLQQILAKATDDARKAIALDPHDYRNTLNLASIYQSISPLGIEGSIDAAVREFDKTLELRPSSPMVYLAKATLERARGNKGEARTLVEKAISLRNQYTDAIFLLAQMQLEENDSTNAERSVQAITMFEPTNPVAFFQLGLLRYGVNNFTGAAQAFERAIAINGEYANARYFLGLTYVRLGNRPAALEQFESVKKTNPDNADVQAAIDMLSTNMTPKTPASDDIKGREGVPVPGVDEEVDSPKGKTDQKDLTR